jgi:hypothetical protein
LPLAAERSANGAMIAARRKCLRPLSVSVSAPGRARASSAGGRRKAHGRNSSKMRTM